MAVCSQNELAAFIIQLSSISNVDAQRFVKTNCVLSSEQPQMVLTTLRSPFRTNQMQNSYVCIKHITNNNSYLLNGYNFKYNLALEFISFEFLQKS